MERGFLGSGERGSNHKKKNVNEPAGTSASIGEAADRNRVAGFESAGSLDDGAAGVNGGNDKDLSDCGRFESFVFDKWSQRAKADSLSELHLIAEPTDVCPLHSDNDSPKFQFSCYYKEDPASSFGNLERLISIGLCACTNLESFSRSICSLQCLRKLTLEGSITEAPRDLDQLECLEELTFSSTEIKHLPDSICMLKHLKSLELKSCFLLEKLPDDLGQIESLETLTITDCNRLRDIPNNMGKIKCVISPKVDKRYTHGKYKQRPINDAVDRPTGANT